jgi:ELWxxDGT repeat protein
MYQKYFLFLFLFLLNFTNEVLAQSVTLVKDIYPGFESSSSARRSIVNGNTAYFPAENGKNGAELWKSDGTEAGTVMVKDINPGSADSEPQSFCLSGNFVFFIADDGVHGAELWRTDGTEAGTKMVKDIVVGSANGGIDVPFQEAKTFAALNGKVYFHADGGVWVSDGTEAGTKIFKAASVSFDFATFNNRVFFITRDGFNESVWASDGTAAGTKSIAGGTPRDLTSSSLGVFFDNNNELILSDGSETGTKVVTEIGTGFGSFDFTYAHATMNGKFYFLAADDSNVEKLWQTDGTASGTKVIDAKGVPFNSSRRYFTVVGNNMYYFYNEDDDKPRELWKTDGTVAGTIKLAEFEGGSLNSVSISDAPIAFKNKLYLGVERNGGDTEFWTSDGTVAGTKRSFVVNTGFAFYQFSTGLMPLTDKIVFYADVETTNDFGEELWQYTPPLATNALQGSITTSDIIKCNGDKTVDLFVNVFNGAAPYTFKWNIAGITGNNPTGLGANTYTVTVTDTKGASSVFTKSITQPEPFKSSNATIIPSAEVKNGEISMTISGATPPYTYLWNTTPAQTTSTIKNIGAGNYIFTVTDANGCKQVQNLTIKALDSLKVDFIKTGDIKCNGDKNVALSAFILGGKSPYSVLWNNNAITNDILNLIAGTYSVTVTDSRGIKKTTTTNITQPVKLNLSLLKTDATGNNKDGTATVTATGGTLPYTYKWNTVPQQVSVKAANLATGTYTVTVTDKNLCTAIGSVTIKSNIATNELADAIGLKLFPNPTQQYLTIELKQNIAQYDIMITDMLGQKVMTQTMTEQTAKTIDVSAFPAGLYTLQLFLEGKLATSSFIISK